MTKQTAYTRKVGAVHNAYDAITNAPILGGQGWKSATQLWRWLQSHGYNVTKSARAIIIKNLP